MQQDHTICSVGYKRYASTAFSKITIRDEWQSVYPPKKRENKKAPPQISGGSKKMREILF